ncbi:hypothetical protein IWW43_005766 [Coemansia sp. RSA 1935]|nr:hypothetical protein J3F82_005679 [Coemansia sp. RSA 637]KAJ2527727.1 hypothetical protein IWW43_005766 [Coemansia sp. RSA 1935]
MSTEDKGAPANPDPDSVQTASKRARQRIAKAARADEANGDSAGSKPKRTQRRGKGGGTAGVSKESSTAGASKGSTPVSVSKGSNADSASKGASTGRVGGTGDTSSSSRTGERKRGAKGVPTPEATQPPGTKSQAGSSAPASGEEPAKGRSRGRRRTNKAGTQPESTPVSAGDEQSGVKTPSEAKPKTPRRARAGRQAREAEANVSASGSVAVAVRDADRECGDSGRAARVTLPGRDAGVERLDPATKVCVRWLPADLPEHVFWQSIESSLPWFDASHTGSVVEHERLVLATTEPSANSDTPAPETELQPTEATDAGTSISPHAATTTGTMCVYESANVSRLDTRPYWRQFVAGKQYQSRAKAAEPSRAYIVFATASEAREFHQKYHGHMFTKNGMQSRARVEQAMFQCMAVTDAVDPLEGSIDDDPAFRAFLDPTHEHEKREVPARVSYATATAADAGEDVTPLIQYLRKLKAKRVPRGVPQQPKAAAKAAVKAVAKAAPKASQGAAKGAASKKPKDDSTKKPRRQNR